MAILVATEPVALKPIANVSLVRHALDALAEAGVKTAAVTVDAALGAQLDLELTRAHPEMELVCREHDGRGGLAAALGGLSEFVADEPFALHLVDSLSRGSLGALLEPPGGDFDVSVLVEEEDDDAVVQLGRRGTAPPSGLPAGVWVLGPGALGTIGEIEASGSAELDVLRATNQLAARGGAVSVRHVGDWWRFRGRPDALLEANRFALAGLQPERVRAELINSHIQGAVRIDPSARLRNAIVRGPAVIGAGACLEDAYVGPYSSVGDDVVIEGAEIEHSIILAGASIRHLGGRLEASVVGPGARVFRDFRLPRAMRLNIGEGAEVSLA